MRILVFWVIFATMAFGSMATGHAEEGGLPGGIRAIIQEAINPGDWFKETRHRIHQENERVDRMFDHRELSRHEAERFRDELSELRERVQRMENEGSFSQRERERMDNHLERLHREISGDRQDE